MTNNFLVNTALAQGTEDAAVNDTQETTLECLRLCS